MAKHFHLLLTDHDRGLFTIVGPMTDDTEWNRRIVAQLLAPAEN